MNSKVVFVVLLACLASSFALSKGLGERIECYQQSRAAQTRVFESKIREAVEKIRQTLKQYLDPLDATDLDVNIDNQLIKLVSRWTAKSQGISNFDLSELSLSLIGLNLKFKVHFPLVTGSGKYDVDLTTPLIENRIFGKGDFDVTSTKLTVRGSGKVATRFVHGKVVPQIKKLEVDCTLEDFKLALTGFMNDEELSQKISTTLTNDLPQMLQKYKAELNGVIAKVIPYVNDYLAGDFQTYGVTPATC